MNEKNNDLIEAVKNDALNQTKSLLAEGCDDGADLFWTTEEGVSLLDEAVEHNRLDLAELFIEKGIDPAETRRKSGMTALMLAACFEYLEMMELLYEKGADLYAVDQMGFTAADFARKLRKTGAQKWIEEKMENPF